MNLLKRKDNRHVPKEWKEHVNFFTGGWFFALIFFYVMRQVGVSGFPHLHLNIFESILLFPLFAIISGVVFGSLHYIFQKYFFRRIPLWKLMVRLSIDQLLIISLLTLIYYTTVKMMIPMPSAFGSLFNRHLL